MREKVMNQIKDNTNYLNYCRYLDFFDKCFKETRFNAYEDWTAVGMGLMNIYGMDAFPIFNYFSSKGDNNNYKGEEITKKKYLSFKNDYKPGYTIGTIYYYARIDNPEEYVKIMYEEKFQLGDVDIARKIKELAGGRFICKKTGKR